jgi:predicted TIM-barrel fold metal-dependent hydrolase
MSLVRRACYSAATGPLPRWQAVRWLDTARELVASLSAEALALIFEHNAKRIYRI